MYLPIRFAYKFMMDSFELELYIQLKLMKLRWLFFLIILVISMIHLEVCYQARAERE